MKNNYPVMPPTNTYSCRGVITNREKVDSLPGESRNAMPPNSRERITLILESLEEVDPVSGEVIKKLKPTDLPSILF